MTHYYRWQPKVRHAYLRSLMLLQSFRQGWDDYRQGKALNSDAYPSALDHFLEPLAHLQPSQQSYEAGRAFAALHPDIELMQGGDLNSTAVKLFVTAQKEWRDAVAARFTEERP
jgi:hypothetical protein